MSVPSVQNDFYDVPHFTLQEGWLNHKVSEVHDWRHAWGLLRSDKVLLLFTSEDKDYAGHFGTIRLDKDTSFISEKDHKDHKDLFAFKLQNRKRKEKYKFQVRTPYEREMWKVYIVGLTTGSIPEGVVLSPEVIQAVVNKLRMASQNPPSTQFTFPNPSNAPQSPGRDESPSLHSTAVDTWPKQRRPSAPVAPSAMSRGSGGSSGSGGESDFRRHQRHSTQTEDSGVVDDFRDGGPTFNHKFTLDGNRTVPTWFFENLTRERANEVLTNCSRFGNTLMRVSTTARDTGSYAISHRTTSSSGRTETAHYEVMRVAEGFRINVENCNTACRSLTEVMECFAELAGRHRTHLMTFNNTSQLLGHDEVYSDCIPPDTDYEVPEVMPPCPPPPCSAPVTSIPDLDFVPVAPPPPSMVPPPNHHGSMTLSRNKLGGASTKSQHESGAKTLGYGDSRALGKGKQSVLDIEQQMFETHAIRRLDLMLKGEEAKSLDKAPEARSGDRPPAVPPVPIDRPKLEHAHLGQSVSDEVSTAFWNKQKRSQSVPNVDVGSGFNMNAHAPVHQDKGEEVFETRVRKISTAEADEDDTTDYLLPLRRTSMPFGRLLRLRERWSQSRRASKVPLPLPPDYSSEEEEEEDVSDTNSSSGSSRSEASTLDGWTVVDVNEEETQAVNGPPRPSAPSDDSGSPTKGEELEREEGVAGAAGASVGEEYSVRYSEIVVEPRGARLRPPCPDTAAGRRPESMIYTEVLVGPEWAGPTVPTMTVVRPEKALLKETSEPPPPIVVSARPKMTESPMAESVLQGEAGSKPKEGGGGGASAASSGVRPSSEAEPAGRGKGVGGGRRTVGKWEELQVEESAYYLDLLGEDEVVYDLMYASGKGVIQFWPLQDHAPGDATLTKVGRGESEKDEGKGQDAQAPVMTDELQNKLQRQLQKLELETEEDRPADDNDYESYDLYQNVP